MGFVSMFIPMLIAFFFVVIVIFAIIWLTGLAVTIFSAIRRGQAKKAGTKPHKAGLITGITLMALPFLIVGGISVYNSTQPNTYRMTQDWSDSLQSGIETGDTQLVYSIFSEYTKSKDNKLYSEIEKMLAYIDGDMEIVRKDKPSRFGHKWAEDGSIIEECFEGRMTYIAADSGQEYLIYYFGYCTYDEDENKLGLERVFVKCDDKKIGAGITTAPYVKG